MIEYNSTVLVKVQFTSSRDVDITFNDKKITVPKEKTHEVFEFKVDIKFGLCKLIMETTGLARIDFVALNHLDYTQELIDRSNTKINIIKPNQQFISEFTVPLLLDKVSRHTVPFDWHF
jgi:hypothetical protein